MPFSARAMDCSVASSDCSARTPATASMIDSRPRTTRVAETFCMCSPGKSVAGGSRLSRAFRCERSCRNVHPVDGLTIVVPATIVYASVSEALSPRHLVQRLAQIGVLVVVGVLLLATLPGLGEVRERFSDARPGWVAAALLLEVGSVVAFIVVFRGVFCLRMPWGFSAQVGLS